MVVGITGSIASGKSLVSNYLKEKHYFVVDADEIAKNLMKVDGKSYPKVVHVFGDSILQEDKSINRSLLALLIFEDEKAREILNKIVHEDVLSEIKKIINENLRKYDIIFIDVPLLFEAGYDSFTDFIICVYTKNAIQLKRLMERDQITHEYAYKKIQSQMPIKEKMDRSDFTIDNSQDIKSTYMQIEEILKKLKGANL